MRQKKPVLTVVTPSFNQGKFIADTFRSILKQDLKSGELQYIIVDAVSTDDTDKVVRRFLPKFKAKGISVHYIREKDQGQADAINKGLRLAKGDIFTYINSDDYYESNALRKTIDFYRNNHGLQWAYGGWNVVNGNGKLFRTYLHNTFSANALRTYSANIGQPACFFTRDLFKKVGRLNTKLHLAMDYDLWLKFLQICDPVLMPFVVANLRYYSTTKSAKFAIQHNREAYLVALSHLPKFFLLPKLWFRYFSGFLMIKLRRNISQLVT